MYTTRVKESLFAGWVRLNEIQRPLRQNRGSEISRQSPVPLPFFSTLLAAFLTISNSIFNTIRVIVYVTTPKETTKGLS